jgi:hypothetical protein
MVMKTVLAFFAMLPCFILQSQRALKFEPVEAICFQNPMMPLPILDHFARKFPEATPYWGIEGEYYSLKYVDPATSLARAIIYDRHGKIIRYENEVAFNDCPAPLQEFYLKKYPSRQQRIWCCEQGNDRKYFFRTGSKTLWFDKDGTYLRKKPI